MRDQLRRAFESMHGGGPLACASRRAEAAVLAVDKDPCPYGSHCTPGLQALGEARDRAIEELMEALADHARANGLELPEGIVGGPPDCGPRDVADWFRIVSAYTREILGWPVIDWPSPDPAASWQSESTVRAAADRAEREILPGRAHDHLVAETDRLTEAVCAWLSDPHPSCAEQFDDFHIAFCELHPIRTDEEYPIDALALYLSAIRQHVRD